MERDGRRAARALRDQFFSSYRMLQTFVDLCPDEVWFARFYGFEYPVWYQVYHVAYFVDYWLREDYGAQEFLCREFDARIPPEFEHEVPEGVCVSREEARVYLIAVGEKLGRFFGALRDDMLGLPIISGHDRFTYQDVVMGQVRHVMYNVGYLNGILRGLDLPESDWYSYNEEDE